MRAHARAVSVPGSLQLYFQQLRPLTECAADDGPVVGHLLLNMVERASGSAKELPHRIRRFCQQVAMLRDCGFPLFSAMLRALVSFDIRSGPDHLAVAAEPALITEEQATAVGRMLMSAVCEQPGNAFVVDNFVLVYAALRTMKQKFPWFVPMLKTITLRRLGGVATSQMDTRQRLSRLGTLFGHGNAIAPQQVSCQQSFDLVVRT
jgi:hypothetical protein